MADLPCLPNDYYERVKALEDAYMSHTDPLRQSGFGGGPVNWRNKRGIVLEAIDTDGTFLDVGCANGYLLECLVSWADERGIRLVPYGLDVGERLIHLARQRSPQWAEQFFVGDIWDWNPPRRFDYVCTSLCVPPLYKAMLFDRLVTQIVEPDGRLILRCYYKSTVDGLRRDYFDEYFDNKAFLKAHGITPVGSIMSDSPGAEYVWIDC
jgi:SAM-dependent methyltransferase